MPFRYLDDIAIADVAFEAWGGSVEEVFAAAADATLGAMLEDAAALAAVERREVHVRKAALDLLLHGFLEEIVFYKDAESLFLRARDVHVRRGDGGFEADAVLEGERIDPARHEILTDVKAVTLHHLEFKEMPGGRWMARVILDV